MVALPEWRVHYFRFRSTGVELVRAADERTAETIAQRRVLGPDSAERLKILLVERMVDKNVN
jgi:hypothetical protein